MVSLAVHREEAGDRRGAEDLYLQAYAHGNTRALVHLVLCREADGDSQGVESLARRAADHGDTRAMSRLAAIRRVFKELWQYGLDPDGTPTPRWWSDS
ncbi:hypothetical protein WN71_026295 [Streptomyces mangrovisoli]|uniref:Sel1 repeat family protein n=2 Tax=Streptomyces mangrovisoli TaxID=1428628 RepID=A0A1J4NUS7_9ACTN|nr:hypothetical protein WN71_026295 [Streptomyces mangrovisoli]